MASAAVAAAIGLVRRRPWAVLAGIAAGSALVFLGLLDVLFNLEQGLYARPAVAMAVETLINFFCLAGRPFCLLYFWRHRDRLGCAAASRCRVAPAGRAGRDQPLRGE